MKKGGKVWGVIILIFVLIAFVGGSIGLIKVVSDVAGKGYVAVLKDNGNVADGASLGNIKRGDTFTVVTSGKFNIKIEAISSEQGNFLYNLGEESGYTWAKDMDGADVTEMFDIGENDGVVGKTITLKFTSINEMLTEYYQKKYTTAETVTGAGENLPNADIFRLTLTGINTVSFTFGIFTPVEGIKITPNIYF